jgi:hypothetical protein
VSARKKSIQCCGNRRRNGSHNIPSITGITPTKIPMSVKAHNDRPPLRGVSVATAISCENFTPLELMSVTSCASPSTHG